MFFRLYSPTDDNLSYRISKNPANIYERKYGNNTTVTGKFTSDNEFSVEVKHSAQLIITHCKVTRKTSYNDATFWVAGPYNLSFFKQTFSSVLGGNMDASLTDEQRKEVHTYALHVACVSQMNVEKMDKLIDGLGLTAIFYSDGMKVASTVTFSGQMTLTELLQKVYIVLYAYQYRYSLGTDKVQKLEMLKRYFENWIDQAENKEYIIELLSGHRLYKLATLDEEYGTEKVATVEQKISESLHTLRHQTTKQLMEGSAPYERWLDLGCGSGQLYQHIGQPDLNTQIYVGLDADKRKLQKFNKRPANVNTFQTNILYPYFNIATNEFDPNIPTIMTLIEVIEHFDEKDRWRLYNLIQEYYQPDTLIITTPNLAWNKVKGNGGKGFDGYRHKDHKIEFDVHTVGEITEGLGNYYVEPVCMEEGVSWEEQATFVFKCIRWSNTISLQPKPVTGVMFDELANLYDGTPKQNAAVNRGLCGNQVVQNHKNLFFMGATMAPADATDDTLESMDSAIDYYNSKGIKNLMFEEKVMGSRAYILYFKDFEEARKYGYNGLIYINSRNGFQFFDDEQQIVTDIWKELHSAFPNLTMGIFDCEILPWSLKAKGLIEREFLVPIEAEFLHHTHAGNPDPELLRETEIALQQIYQHSAVTPIKVYIFDVIVASGISVIHLQRSVVLPILRDVLRNCIILKVVDFDTNSFALRERVPLAEGIVVKPNERTPNVLPAIKVRNHDFLRLIYGTHYTEYFDMLKDRPLGKKRMMSHVQWQLGRKMIPAFLIHDKIELLKLIGLFIDGDTAYVKTGDNTL